MDGVQGVGAALTKAGSAAPSSCSKGAPGVKDL
jgi:hypothetical protein